MRHIKIILLSFFVSLLISNSIVAQDGDMMVYHISGKATISGKALQKGSLLQKDDLVDVQDGASLVLICKSFQVIKIEKKGKYAVSGLNNQCNVKPSSFTASYFKYVWKEFTHKHGTPQSNPLDYMTNVGAVNRGMDILETGISVDTIHYYRGELPLRFLNLPEHYFITVYNDEYDGGIESKKSFAGSKVFLNTVFEALAPGVYYWQVADSTQNLSTRKYVRIWDKASYQAERNDLLQDLPQTTAAETAFMEAFVLADHHFLQESYNYLKLALTLTGNHKTYLNAYDKIFF